MNSGDTLATRSTSVPFDRNVPALPLLTVTVGCLGEATVGVGILVDIQPEKIMAVLTRRHGSAARNRTFFMGMEGVSGCDMLLSYGYLRGK